MFSKERKLESLPLLSSGALNMCRAFELFSIIISCAQPTAFFTLRGSIAEDSSVEAI